MDFALSEEQQEVRDLARKILEDLSTHERLVEVEASAEGIDRALWQELAKSNLLGVGLPEEFGGSEMGFFSTCVLLEEVGRTVAAVPAIPTLVLGALPIAHFGSDEQKRRLLPGVVNGDILLPQLPLADVHAAVLKVIGYLFNPVGLDGEVLQAEILQMAVVVTKIPPKPHRRGPGIKTQFGGRKFEGLTAVNPQDARHDLQ